MILTSFSHMRTRQPHQLCRLFQYNFYFSEVIDLSLCSLEFSSVCSNRFWGIERSLSRCKIFKQHFYCYSGRQNRALNGIWGQWPLTVFRGQIQLTSTSKISQCYELTLVKISCFLHRVHNCFGDLLYYNTKTTWHRDLIFVFDLKLSLAPTICITAVTFWTRRTAEMTQRIMPKSIMPSKSYTLKGYILEKLYNIR